MLAVYAVICEFSGDGNALARIYIRYLNILELKETTNIRLGVFEILVLIGENFGNPNYVFKRGGRASPPQISHYELLAAKTFTSVGELSIMEVRT